MVSKGVVPTEIFVDERFRRWCCLKVACMECLKEIFIDELFRRWCCLKAACLECSKTGSKRMGVLHLLFRLLKGLILEGSFHG